MSRAINDQQLGWNARSDYWGDDLLWLGARGSIKIHAIILPAGLIDPQSPWGNDAREKDTMQIDADTMPDIAYGDVIARGSDKWKVLSRVNSPADFVAVFELVKVVTAKDTSE